MNRTLVSILAGCAFAAATPVLAQAPAAPSRAPGPALGPAVDAARDAVEACRANGYKTTALIVDSAGVPIVMLSGDGAAERTQAIASQKAWTVIKYKVPSGDIADRVAQDPALDAAIKADPQITRARRGALPIMAGGQLIGAFAVSGAPGGDKDEVCVKAALDKAGQALK
jgi:uncharacterized protein GlcG (DUF336 family)